MSIDVQLLKQADFSLSKCGRPIPPSGLIYVPIPFHFVFQANHAQGTTETVPQEIDGDAIFLLRAISIIPPINQLYFRVQFPTGRYWQNLNRTMSQVAGTGSQRYPLERAVPCEPGSRLQITIDDRPTNNGAGAPSTTPVQMLFEGVFIYAVRGSQLEPVRTIADAANMDRYFLTPNQNIMAPEIALNLRTDNTPPGNTDGEYIVCDPNPLGTGFTLDSTGSLATTREVLISGFQQFLVRRMIFIPSATAGLTGQWLVRVTDLSGYSFTNGDYIEIEKFSNGPYACDWPICGGRKLIFDYSVVDVAGTPGTFSMQTLIRGVRRA